MKGGDANSGESADVKHFKGKVAVITGAASGIGHALGRCCAAKGMRIVLADVERDALAVTAAELRASGASVAAVLTDVSKPKDVELLAEKTLARFEAVHLLFNNAGVGLVGPRVWETTCADWEWLLGVNLSGVVHGLRVFVPHMLEQEGESHIVNTASAAGLVCPPGMGLYNACKSGIVSLSETLHHELALAEARIKVTVLCPGLVRTRMPDSSRNRPTALQNEPEREAERAVRCAKLQRDLREATEKAISPSDVADRVFDAIRDERFFVFTHDWVEQALETRTRNVLDGRVPWIGIEG
jgi:NAD(P)-dependent dehydrogenase (short-subunit alcohol dehydrogenase family)